ncbi:energy transducer TonB [Kordiimonas pumila]|uniref:Energy transducer TonB n=1 Tax=Kordiimonas pumila TaxID=2161677 RepID=A0ABV7D7I3_9PROT|nr:energy transducer TonB [Kordiimonas pumila]
MFPTSIKKTLLGTALLSGLFLATPLASAQASDTYDAWAAKVRSKIASQQSYPQIALDKKLQGQVLLLVQMTAKGQLKGATIIETSGHELLDMAALKQVINLKSLPAVPEGLEFDSLLVPVSFTL